VAVEVKKRLGQRFGRGFGTADEHLTKNGERLGDLERTGPRRRIIDACPPQSAKDAVFVYIGGVESISEKVLHRHDIAFGGKEVIVASIRADLGHRRVAPTSQNLALALRVGNSQVEHMHDRQQGERFAEVRYEVDLVTCAPRIDQLIADGFDHWCEGSQTGRREIGGHHRAEEVVPRRILVGDGGHMGPTAGSDIGESGCEFGSVGNTEGIGRAPIRIRLDVSEYGGDQFRAGDEICAQ
jgi:hypothetical protein